MKKIFALLFIIALIPLAVLAAKPLDPMLETALINYVNLNGTWCDTDKGNKIHKVAICHSTSATLPGTNKTKYNYLCVDFDSLRQGHFDIELNNRGELIIENGHQGHRDPDFFLGPNQTSCNGDSGPENSISIYPCNAGMKRRDLNPHTRTVGDSTSVFGSYNDYIHADIASGISNPEDNSYDEYNYQTVSVAAGRSKYNELTETPFSTMLDTDRLNFKLHSETYGTNYYVDWCITETQPEEKRADVALAPSSIQYTNHAELVTKFELYCGDDTSNLHMVNSSSYERIGGSFNYSNLGLPATKYCMWRQRFIETKQSKRPNRAIDVNFNTIINIE